MISFAERSFANYSNGPALFDLTISGNGRYITPAVVNSTWNTRKRDVDQNFVVTGNAGFGSAQMQAIAHSRNNQFLFVNHLSTVYRATRDGDNFPYDGWSLATGTPRAMDTNADGTMLAAGVGNDVIVWDTATKTQRISHNAGSLVEDVRFSPDGTFLVAGSRSHGPFLFSVSGTTVTHRASLGAGYGNWNVTWHPDSDHFAVSQYAFSGVLGLHIYKKTGPKTFARIPSAFDDGGFTGSVVPAAYLGGSGAGYILANGYGTSDWRLYRRNGDIYERQTLVGMPPLQIEIMRAASDAETVTLYTGINPSTVRVFDFGTPPIDASGDLVGPFADIESYVQMPVDGNAELEGPFAEVAGEALVALGGEGELTGPFSEMLGAVAIGDEGDAAKVAVRVFPAQLRASGAGALVEDAAGNPFIYGQLVGPFADIESYVQMPVDGNAELEGPFAEVAGEVTVDSAVLAELRFPAFGSSGTAGFPLAISTDLSFPAFSAEGEGDNGIEGIGAGADLGFPRLSVEGSVAVPFAVVETELGFPSFKSDGVMMVPLVANASMSFPSPLRTDGLVGNFYLTAHGSFPRFGAEGLIGNFYATGAATFPKFGSDGLVGNFYLTSEATFPRFGSDGLVGNFYLTSEATFPKFGSGGLVTRPDFIDANLRFPKFAAAGVVSFQSFVSGELSFPVFRVRGSNVDIIAVRATGVSFGSASGNFSFGNSIRLAKGGSPFRMG